jgi:CHAT domain-containing protein/tetratricopeptide (TPR) repeat protein
MKYSLGLAAALLTRTLVAEAGGAPTLLELGRVVEARIAGGESHEYRLSLGADQYAKVVVAQRTVPASVSVFDPGGKPALEAVAASPGSFVAAEWIASETGGYRVVIAVQASAPPGEYSIELQNVEPATDRHRNLAAATRALLRGNVLANQGTGESLREAVAAYRETAAHRSSAGDEIGHAMALYSAAMTYIALGEKDQAVKYATDAVAHGKVNPDTEGWALSILGLSHSSFGDRGKAIEYYDRALPLMREAKDRGGEGAVLSNLGTCHAGTGELRKAVDDFTGAVAAFEATQDRWRLSTALSNLGVVYGDLGEYPKALETHLRSLALKREVGDRSGEAVTQNNIGSVYSNLADFQKALDAYRAALEIHRSLGREWNAAINLHNIAWVHATLGDRERARGLYEEALDMLRKVKDQASMANTLNSLAGTWADLGGYEKAIAYYNEALALRKTTEDRGAEATSRRGLGAAYGKIGEVGKAREQFDAALAILRHTGNRRRLAVTLASAGAFELRQRDYSRALTLLEESLAIYRVIRDGHGEAEALAELARLERDRGDVARAHHRAGEALAALESVRRTVASPNLRAQFFALSRSVQEMDIALLMRMHAERPGQGFGEAALVASECSRARSLLEILGESAGEIRRGVDPALTARERELEQLTYAKAEQQTRLLNGKSAAPDAAARVARELNSLTVELDDVRSRIRQASPRYVAAAQPEPLGLKQIQQQVLDAETTLLEYSLGADKSFLWAVTPTTMEVFELPGKGEIEPAAKHVYELLTARNTHQANKTPEARSARIRRADDEYSAAAANVSRMLLGPVASLIKGKRLLIVADGALQYLPFSALPDPVDAAVPLIVNHEIAAAPSASVLAAVRRESAGRKTADKAIAIVADPVFSATDARVASGTRGAQDDSLDFVRLRFSRSEADEIARLAPADATLKALDFDASRDKVLTSDLGRYRIVHFATHAVLNNQHPELSGVVLSRVDRTGRPQNGFLRLYDIYNLQLSSDLVVLSACETALGGEIQGEGLIGLTRAFLYAGAPRVVASLWQVDDRAAAEIMRRFYTAMLKGGERPAAALRSAQTELWKAKGWAIPYYWAAFTFEGEWQ